MTGLAVGRSFAGAFEDHADQTFRFAHEFVKQLRSFDRQEHATSRVGAFGERVRHGFGDQCLAVAWRTVQQHAFRRFQVVAFEQFAMLERHLHGVADTFYLLVQSADVGEGDVRHFLQNQIVVVFGGNQRKREPQRCVDVHAIARADGLFGKRSRASDQRHVARRHPRPAGGRHRTPAVPSAPRPGVSVSSCETTTMFSLSSTVRPGSSLEACRFAAIGTIMRLAPGSHFGAGMLHALLVRFG